MSEADDARVSEATTTGANGQASPASISEADVVSDDAPSGWPPKLIALGAAFVTALGLDQATKLWIAANLPVGGTPRPVIDGFFYLSHMRNAGAAFGFFEDVPVELRRIGFSVVAALAGWVVLLFYRSMAPGDRLNGLALGCIVGGGLGNLIDRLARGEVIDFVRFELWGPWSFPDFNLADVFIMVGVTILMIELLVSEGVARAEVIESGDGKAG